jgi:arylsulfatase
MTVSRETHPDIILILVDDMGFTDLGCMGSEIRTPNIDSIAKNGMLLSSMYNSARCCPTRASLLTGMYPHNAGVGQMGANLGTKEYQGFLRSDTTTIAEAVKRSGYRTLMSGKWHVAGDLWATRVDTWRVGSEGHPTPRQRGFDRFYGILDGVSNFFSPHYLMKDDERIYASPTDFYFTDAITDEALLMIDESITMEKPYFLYLAHTAPHWPLHAHEEDIAKYETTYRSGWDSIRTARHEELNSLGSVEKNWQISPRDEASKPWDSVDNKQWESERMAVYAAMIDRLDQNVGRVIDHLKAKGTLDNTLIMFLSDNGGCAELMKEDGWAKFFPDTNNDGSKIIMGNRPDLRPGSAQTYMSYDLPWANVSNTPFRKFKHYVHEGGISTPLLVQWPKRFNSGGVSHSPTHVADVLPTILDAAGLNPISHIDGYEIQPLDGESFLPLLEKKNWQRERPLYWEHEGNCAIRVGDFKLVKEFQGDWELYNIVEDRTEMINLAQSNRALKISLENQYSEWADKTGVLPWERLLPVLQRIWEMPDVSQTESAS